MTLLTDRFGLPFPEDPDDPNGPLQIEALANATEDRLAFAGAQGGSLAIPDEQFRENVAYGMLGTPDRIQGLELPGPGFFVLGFQALWKAAGGNKARAAIFLDGTPGGGTLNQVKMAQAGAVPLTAIPEAQAGGVNNMYQPLASAAFGLHSGGSSGPAGSDVTTGQVLGMAQEGGVGFEGGLCVIFAAAGTYDISIQFKSLDASRVTVKERKLAIWTKEFPLAGI